MFESEPSYTNYAHCGNEPQTFVGTIDYIFCSENIGVSSVIPIATFEDGKTELCPNETEPSDHLLIGATLTY